MGFTPYRPLGPLGADSCENTKGTEFSWGPGPVAPGCERKPPDEGGMYVGRSPSMVDPPKGKYRKSGAPIGYAGEVIAQ